LLAKHGRHTTPNPSCSAAFCLVNVQPTLLSGKLLNGVNVVTRLHITLYVAVVQAEALQALEAAGLTASYSTGDSNKPLAALASSLTSSFLQLMHTNRRQSKRPLVLCGALVNTVMLPELMVFNPQQQPQLVALHAGPDAPLRRFVGGLLQPGAKGSPTLYLAVALRLAACIPAAPHLLEWYAAELQQLLLFGTVMEAGIDNKVCVVSAELSLLFLAFS
jgi:hypothetical protein